MSPTPMAATTAGHPRGGVGADSGAVGEAAAGAPGPPPWRSTESRVEAIG